MIGSAILFTLFGGALAQTPPVFPAVTDLHIKNAFLQPDGFNRSFVTAEGIIPGPTISGNKGDTFKINLINELTNGTMILSTSIHWHGIFQETTNWADGPPFVNQCPIAANNSFLYEFTVPDQAGTFWYHSHLATQYCDQLRGGLVVYDPNDALADLYDVDNGSTIIHVGPLYHVPAPMIPTGSSVVEAGMINSFGRNWFTQDPTPLTVINVEEGLRYRFRLIHSGCDQPFNFSIDFHTFQVIEADGIEHEPVVADAVQIFVAQRYSLVMAANQSVDNYWIKSNDAGASGTAGFANGINSAILRYLGAPDAEPTKNQAVIAQNTLNEFDLHPIVNPQAPGEPTVDGADVIMNLQLFWTVGGNGAIGTTEQGNFFFVNGVRFFPPTVPVLLQIISGARTAQELLPTGSVYALPLNSTIQISFNTTQVFQHGGPHAFSGIRVAGSDVYNFENPVQRDVISTGAPGDNVTIRFFTDNAGPWFLHCHIDWHLEGGFAIVLAEGTAETTARNPTPEDWDQLCPIYDALTPAQLGGAGGPTT
ncbi:laccase [Rhodocollybia butyracea]|uniref:Laccase n=1 Tax=Rhodocollybia butyracea TaxID=206335 RepID=A0A9P5PGD8_9AGAR|nr:laccase [Rhodocollybia butyracea]